MRRLFFSSNWERGSTPTWFNHFYLSVKFVFIVGVFYYFDRNFYAGRYPTLSQLELSVILVLKSDTSTINICVVL